MLPSLPDEGVYILSTQVAATLKLVELMQLQYNTENINPLFWQHQPIIHAIHVCIGTFQQPYCYVLCVTTRIIF